MSASTYAVLQAALVVSALLTAAALYKRAAKRLAITTSCLLLAYLAVYGPVAEGLAPYMVADHLAPEQVKQCKNEMMRRAPFQGYDREFQEVLIASNADPRRMSFHLQCLEQQPSFRMMRDGWVGVARELWRLTREE